MRKVIKLIEKKKNQQINKKIQQKFFYPNLLGDTFLVGLSESLFSIRSSYLEDTRQVWINLNFG